MDETKLRDYHYKAIFVRNVNTKREVAIALGGPMHGDESLRERWVRGIVVDLDDVQLGLSASRPHCEREQLRVCRGAIKADSSESRSVTLEGLADVSRLREQLHVALDATTWGRGDTDQACPALIIVDDIVDDLVVL
jgi:hypothetical protein